MVVHINIDIGPVIVWLSFAFVNCWLLLLAVRGGVILGTVRMTRDILHRTRQTILAPHIAPGAAIRVDRVSPEIALLSYHPKLEEDESG
jgi:hypothetical protein